MLTGFWNLEDIQNACKNCSKNELVRENTMTQAHGSHSLWVMGSCRLPPVLEFVVSSVSCSERFFSWYSVFRSPQEWLMKNHYVDVLLLNCCCGATEGSEQQHNQDLKEIYKGRRILEFITFYHNALHLTRVHCATNNSNKNTGKFGG